MTGRTTQLDLELAPAEDGRALAFSFHGASLLADLSGVLVWPDRSMLVVADLHLEKGSYFAAGGAPLPPYDTRATLDRLGRAIDRYRPRRVVCLGDSFHDREAGARLDPADAVTIASLQRRRDWVWIVGNHDPEIPSVLGGDRVDAVMLDGLVFRHEAEDGASGEISGHYHPKARVHRRRRILRRPCFALADQRLILPAFGAYTGGLDVADPALRRLLGTRFTAMLLGRKRITALAAHQLLT